MAQTYATTTSEQTNVLVHLFTFRWVYLIPVVGFYFYYFKINDYKKSNGYNKQKKLYEKDFSTKKMIIYAALFASQVVTFITLLIVYFNTYDPIWEDLKRYYFFPLAMIDIFFFPIWSLLTHKIILKFFSYH
jgi:hypothetical protein